MPPAGSKSGAGCLGRGRDGVAELFLLAVCCGMNLISAAAYSSDPNRRCYAFLPVSPRRIFLWKTLSGFFWNELLVILFGFIGNSDFLWHKEKRIFIEHTLERYVF